MAAAATETMTVAGTPADPTVRYVPLELGGTTYQLCFDFDAIARAEEMTGMSLLFGVDWSRINIVRTRAMLLACMLKAQPEMTVDKLTKYITHRNMAKIQTALIDAWVNSTPEEDENENPPEPEPSPANG
jgi:hypothetical protein